MDNLECPNCHQRTIPAARKMSLGPATAIMCPACGARIGVPYWSLVAVLPFLAGIGLVFIAVVVGNGRSAVSAILAALALPIGFGMMWWLHANCVPLIIKK